MAILEEILRKCIESRVVLSCAESCTGGMLAAALTELPGSSAMFDRGFITYSNEAKVDLVDVTHATLGTYGAVSEEVAGEMARGALERSAADVSLAITGIAGPGGSANKPEGRVCFAIATPWGTETETQEFGALGRDAVRMAARNRALEILNDYLE